MKEELQYKIIKLIGLFEFLLSVEDFKPYKDLKKNYQILLDSLLQYENTQDIDRKDFDILLNVFRIMLEAPPKNAYLGQYILDRMQEIYIIQKKIEEAI